MQLTTIWGDRKAADDMADRTALVFGGSNMVEGTGRWYDDDGKLWLEPSFTVTVYTSDTVHAKANHNVIAASVLDASTEQAVLIAVNNDSQLLERQEK